MLYGDTLTENKRPQELLGYDNWGPVWTQKTVGGLSRGTGFDLVAVDQSDKEKQRAERDGPRQHGFHQQHGPTAQQEDVDKQPEEGEKHKVS